MSLHKLQNKIVGCQLCPRLVEWRTRVARNKVKRFAQSGYWGKPVPGFGDPDAQLLIVGLAPAAHGANRTGRMFTGDRSGEWLYRALHKFCFTNRPVSISRDDGLELHDCYITASQHCAPPLNKPAREESLNCQPYLLEELHLLKKVKVIVSLGKIATDTVIAALRGVRGALPVKHLQFRHGLEININRHLTLIASYHPSQQNTFTGKLTGPMFDAVFRRAKKLLSP